MTSRKILTYIYKVDHHDNIVDVNNHMNEFELDNSFPELDRNQIIGTSFWDYITDSETIHLYQIILKKVRQSNKPIELPFRCDLSDIRRFMKLKIFPLPDNHLKFQSTLEWEESRSIVKLIVADRCTAREQVTMCSWCHKVKLPNKWRDIEEAIKILRLFDKKRVPQISHGICFDCYSSVLSETRA